MYTLKVNQDLWMIEFRAGRCYKVSHILCIASKATEFSRTQSRK